MAFGVVEFFSRQHSDDELMGISYSSPQGNEDSIAMAKSNADRDANMKFLCGLSDRELVMTVMHAKVTLGMFGV